MTNPRVDAGREARLALIRDEFAPDCGCRDCMSEAMGRMEVEIDRLRETTKDCEALALNARAGFVSDEGGVNGALEEIAYRLNAVRADTEGEDGPE